MERYLMGGLVTIRRALPVICLLLVCPVIGAAGGSLSAEDIAKIKRVHTRYEEAWLQGDADGVRVLFMEDCVLLPPYGDTPRIGQKGLNEYWFPPALKRPELAESHRHDLDPPDLRAVLKQWTLAQKRDSFGLNAPGRGAACTGKILEWFQGRMECDVDDSAWQQTVEKEINPPYWRLIDEFGKRTGVPVVMSTAFNLIDKAIVHSPTDTIRMFFSSGMHALVIGSFFVKK